ncbi:MAG: accessory Sec system protein Asp3 [Candidatus Weimeria sp.]
MAENSNEIKNYDMKWKIFWDEYSSDTYLYGSQIEFLSKEDVYFKNELMPPGTVIKTWYSMVNFQAKRIEPALPIIDGEGDYHISADIDSNVPGGVFLRLVFFAKNGEEADGMIVEGKELDFKCPLKAYSYEVQLICAGAHSLHFHSFTISERMDQDVR